MSGHIVSLGLPATSQGWICALRPARLQYPSLTAIKAAVARHYGLSELDMVCQRRYRSIARPRQVAMYLARKLTPLSYPQIGRRFGGRDHTTVMYAYDATERRIPFDADLAADVARLEAELTR